VQHTVKYGCKNTAFLKLRPVQSSIENNKLSLSNGKSEAQKSYSDTLLRLSAVVNEGKGAVALTEVTSAKNKTAASVCEHRSLFQSPSFIPYERSV